MSIRRKPIKVQGVQLREVTVEGRQTTAIVFNYSKVKQVMAVILLVTMSIGSFFMFLNPEVFDLDIFVIGNETILKQLLFLACLIASIALTVNTIVQLFKAPKFMALSPEGISLSQTRSPIFIEWNEIKEMHKAEVSRSRIIGIAINNLDSNASLKPFLKRVKWNRSQYAMHWVIGTQPYQAAPDLVELALLFFYQHPEKRTVLGTDQGLEELRVTAQAGWQA